MRKSLFLVFMMASFALAGLLAYQINLTKHFKSLVLHLTVGEAVPAVSFLNSLDQPVELGDFKKKPILVFVFERPCSTCTPSIPFWMKLTEVVGEKAHIFGVIGDRVEMMRLAETKRLPFELISPFDDDEFLRKWRIHLNLAQTVVINRGRMKYVKLGNLRGEDMRAIMNTIHEGEEK